MTHPERRRPIGTDHDGRGQRVFPMRPFVGEKCCGPVLFGVGSHAEGAQHREQGRFRHHPVPARPVDVVRGDAVTVRELDQ